jgi:hypothetical protein
MAKGEGRIGEAYRVNSAGWKRTTRGRTRARFYPLPLGYWTANDPRIARTSSQSVGEGIAAVLLQCAALWPTARRKFTKSLGITPT